MYKGIFDSHAHYDDERFDEDRDELLLRLNNDGVVGIINCGTTAESSRFSVKLAEKYPFIYAACGIHPNDADKIKSGDFAIVTDLMKNKKVVAVGEIGLDYHYDIVPRDVQINLFEKQLNAAQYLDKPVIVHNRDSHNDILKLVKKYKPRGVLHCYSGSAEMAKEILKLDMYLGFGGAVTFKKAKKAIEVIKITPIERILLETDCPYMTPEPFRGKRNDSSYILYTAQKIAEIKNIPVQDVIRITAKNTKDLFEI
jgi:TatD DNase family protein